MFSQLKCPNLRCRKILRVPQESRGKLVRCQSCHALLRVPADVPGMQPPRTPIAGGINYSVAWATRPDAPHHVG